MCSAFTGYRRSSSSVIPIAIPAGRTSASAPTVTIERILTFWASLITVVHTNSEENSDLLMTLMPSESWLLPSAENREAECTLHPQGLLIPGRAQFEPFSRKGRAGFKVRSYVKLFLPRLLITRTWNVHPRKSQNQGLAISLEVWISNSKE